jgi:threonine dehydrogenase-like Zn-dependent dehydrogenase
MKTQAVVVRADRDPKKGIVLPGPHQIYRNPTVVIEQRELPDLNPDEIRVKMIYAGICGTDVHLVETNPETGYIRCSAPAVIPNEGRLIGHEGVGRVLAIGSNVRHVKSGAVVTFESIIVCHYCDVCRRGQFNQCRRARLLGLEKDGLFGTVVDVPSMLTHDVTNLASNDQGLRASACIEPAGVAYVACQNTQISGGDEIVIFGAGPIGLFSAILSKFVFGASRTHVVEPILFRREFAKRWADCVYDVEEFFNDPPRSIDVVIEASGVVDNVSQILRRMNPNGRIALLARSGAALHLEAVDHIISNQIVIVGSRGHLGGAFAKILCLYESGRLPLEEVVTSVLNSPEELVEVLRTPYQILHNDCKILTRFRQE